MPRTSAQVNDRQDVLEPRRVCGAWIERPPPPVLQAAWVSAGRARCAAGRGGAVSGLLTVEQAGAVYDILVEQADARENSRDEFVNHLTPGCTDRV